MKNLLLKIAFIEGGIVMLLELTSPLLVTPIFGNSIYVWALILSLSVFSLACGYFLGGQLTKKTEKRDSNLIKLFVLSSMSILLGISGIYLLNGTNNIISEQTLMVLLILTLLAIPLLFLGATTPLIISILSAENKDFTVGKVYSVSTFGGLFFALFTGFYLIPELGLTNTMFFGLLLISSLIFLLTRKKVNKKLVYFSSIIGAIALVLFFVPKGFPESEKYKVLEYSEGINGQIMVADVQINNNEHRILFINRMGQTWIDKGNDFSLWSYPNILTAIGSMYPENSKTLLLGLGGGVVAKQLRQFTAHRVDAVELDQRIIDIAYDYFQLPSSGITTYNEDARTFLNSNEEKYDYIIFDIFNGEIAPSHGLSLEAFQKAKSSLSKNGLVVINFNGFSSGKEGESGQALINTLDAAGFTIKKLPTTEVKEEDRNLLYLAYINEPKWDKITIEINSQDGKFIIPEHLISVKVDKSVPIITDDYPLMERLNYPASKKWRESYFENFTKKYKEEVGLPYVF